MKKNITICISEETNEKLKILSEIYNRSKSNMIETLINIEYKTMNNVQIISKEKNK